MSIPLTRRTLLRTTTATATVSALGALAVPTAAAARSVSGDPLFRELDERIEAGMTAYNIPGVAIGMWYRGGEYLRGYGVTNVDHPTAIDGDTVFRIGSNTKTFTGTTVMRLVEQGRIHLDAAVHTYLPGFRTADPTVARRVTVHQLLNHSAGWLGEYYQDFGRGDDAFARYAAGIARLPQQTAPGHAFAYNNAAVALAGHLIETVTGQPYEDAVRELLVDPLGLSHTRFFPEEVIGFNVAASHSSAGSHAAVRPDYYAVPRSTQPTGGLISSARDLLTYARFHLGDGTAPDGRRLLTKSSLLSMRSNPGPGGTLMVEFDGMGITWMLRPTAEGVRIVQHGGSYQGQYSGFLMVPERNFAFAMLTNADGGTQLVSDLFIDDWALRRFAGVSNLPATPRRLSPAELAPYEGHYTSQLIGFDGIPQPIDFGAVADNGQLSLTAEGQPYLRLVFYRPDYVLVYDPTGKPTPARANFVRDAHGRVEWLRLRGRLYRHER